MQTFSILTFLFALSAAAPHAINHFQLHERALHLRAPALEPLVERGVEALNVLERRQNISPDGQCGSGSGFQCASGFCCSQFGFCGKGPAYCGGGGSGGSSASVAAPSSHGIASAAPSGSVAPSGSASGAPSAPASGSAAPSGSSAPSAPAGSSIAPSAPASGSAVPSGTAAPSAPAGSSSAPSAAAPSSSGSPGSGGSGGGLGNVYKFYTGSGSPSAGWPSQSDWIDFEGMWAANEPTISMSCTEFEETNNSQKENAELKAALQSVGSAAGIDPRFVLAVVMQESKGCVRVDTTDNGVVNPGLMQSHDGTGTCNPGAPGAPGKNPCPASEITQMIKDGTEGTASGDGLKQTLSQCTAEDLSQRYYQAATIYNSGNLPTNLDDNTATACYASDIANRLTGWTTAETKCTLS